MPVWPTWSVCGRQPALVTTREQPTAAFSCSASSSRIAKPSAEPTPRPPLTTTFASASETPLVTVSTCSLTRTARSASSSAGENDSTAGASAPLTVAAATMCGAELSSAGEPCRRASSSRLPPQRTRVRSPSGVGRPLSTGLEVQFAANGSPKRAATWAMTSLPPFEPGATIAEGSRRAARSVSAARPGAGRVGAEPLVLGDMGARHSMCAEAGRGVGAARADEQRLDGLAQLPRQRQRL